MLSSTYGESALSERTCHEWFQRFKIGDFDIEDQHGGGKQKIFEDSELDALFAEDSGQTQEEFPELLGVTQKAISKRLKVMGMIQKQGNWVPYELKPRDFGRRFFGIWQDQLGVVYYELLKQSEIITGNRYRTQLIHLSRALKMKQTATVPRETRQSYPLA